MGLKNGARASGRNSDIENMVRHFFEMSAKLQKVAADIDSNLSFLSLFKIVEMQRTKLFVDNCAGPGGGRHDVHAMIFDHTGDSLGIRIVDPQRDWFGSRRQKVNFAPHPDRIEVAGIFVRYFDDRRIGQVCDPHLGRQATMIVGPKRVHERHTDKEQFARQRCIGQASATRVV